MPAPEARDIPRRGWHVRLYASELRSVWQPHGHTMVADTQHTHLPLPLLQNDLCFLQPSQV